MSVLNELLKMEGEEFTGFRFYSSGAFELSIKNPTYFFRDYVGKREDGWLKFISGSFSMVLSMGEIDSWMVNDNVLVIWLKGGK